MTLDGTSRYRYLAKTKRFLRTFAPISQAICFLVGLGLFLDRARKLLETAYGLGERVEIGVYALVFLGGYGLAGILAYRLCRALAELIDVWVDQALAGQRVLAVLETELAPAVDRLVDAIEALRPMVTDQATKPREPVSLSTDEIVEQLRAAKKTGDADHVLDLRATLVSRFSAKRLEQLDRELAGWLSRFFQQSLRSGKAPLVAGAMGRAVEALADLPDLEHLRAALPAVRQSAGLCGACGKPYRGLDACCPQCKQADR